MDESKLDALLREGLAPPEGAADLDFVARIDRAVAEAERYRRWKAAFLRQLVTEVLTVLALAGSLAFIASVPVVGESLVAAPGLLWPVFLSIFLLWMLVRGRPGAPI